MKNERIEKIRMRLACIFVFRVIMVFIILGVFGLTLWLVNEFFELTLVYIVISCFITMPVFFALYFVVKGGYEISYTEYMALYNHFVTKEAIKYNSETVMEFKENSFDNAKVFEDTGFVGDGSDLIGSAWFVGDYKGKKFEGAYAHSYLRSRPGYYIRRMMPTWLRFVLRLDYMKMFAGVVGCFNDVKFGKDPIFFYDKSNPNKRFIYEFDENSIVKTGNEEFDKLFIVKSARPDMAREFFTDDIINALLNLKKLKIHIGVHLYLNKMNFSINSMDLGFKPPIFKTVDVDKEIEKVKVVLRDYYKSLLVLVK